VPDRVVVLGTAGAGKSTLAQTLAGLGDAEYVDLDALYYAENWEVVSREAFRTRLRALADRPRWVADGSYIDDADRLLWPRAQLIVWLDLPLLVILPRLVRRRLAGTERPSSSAC